jgi:hypothetical protein
MPSSLALSPLADSPSARTLVFLLIVTAIIALGFWLLHRREGNAPGGDEAGPAPGFPGDPGETIRLKEGSVAAKATLTDPDGSAGLDRPVVELFGTTSIGRLRRNADLAVQSNRTASPISRLHCTIIEEDGAFFLRDEQSANGTRLNGVRLAPMERNPLRDGDEIQLADRDGVRLVFRLQHGEATRDGV